MQNLIKTLKKYDIFVYILAILLLLLIASFSFPSRQSKSIAEPTGSWSSYADTEWAGSGTQSSPYLISTPEELAGLAQQVNSYKNYDGIYFRQTANLDVSAHNWNPIGNSGSQMFYGNYDGNNFVISNIYGELFGQIRDSNISNINLINGQASDDSGSVAGLVRSAHASNITNCNVDYDLTYNRSSGAGFVS